MNKTKDNKTKKKRNHKRDYILIDGMKIDGDILLHIDKPMKDHSGLLLLFISVVAAFSTMFLGLSYFDTGANLALVSFSIIVLCTSFAIVKSEESFLRFIGLVVIGLHIIPFALFYRKIANGFIVLYSEYMKKANKPNSVLSAMVEDIPRSERSSDVNLFIILLALIICFGMVFSCYYKINLPCMVLFSFPLFEIGAYWGWKPSTLCFLLLLVCWTTVFALQLVNYSANKAGIRNTFAIHPRKKTFYFTSDKMKKGFFTKYIYSMFIICVCIVLLLYSIVSAVGKDRPDKMIQARRDLSNFIEDMSYRSLTNTLSDLNDTLLGNTNIGGTNGGKLGTVDKISFNGSTALEVTIDDSDYPIYLKGFVAGDYHDNSWDEIDPGDSLEDFADENECYIQDIGFNKLTRMTKVENVKYSPSEFSVTIKGASKKYAYAPYFTSYASDNNDGSDKCKPSVEGCVGLRARNYLMNYYNLSKAPSYLRQFGGNADTGLLRMCYNSEYLRDATETKYEYDYYEYVINTYLDVTESDGLAEAVDNIDSVYLGQKGYQAVYESGSANYSSYINIVNAISNYFDDNFKYTLDPGKTPSDRDFIDYFISEQKVGYCSYFASAGVMLLRHYGIPARYVEGYIIHPDQLGEHNEDNMNEVEVKDKSAHAWAEIYTRELGWIPIEFTPGYEDTNPNLDKKDDKKPDGSTTTTTTAAPKTTTTTKNTKDTDSKPATTTTKQTGNGGSETKASTTTKAVSTDKAVDSDSSGSDNAGGVIGGPFGGDGGSGVNMIIIYIAIILLLIVIIILRRAYNLKKLNGSINSSDMGKAVKSCYNASLRYLSLMGIKESENQSDSKDLTKIIEKMKDSGYSEESSSSFEFLSENAISAYFGKNEPDESISSKCREALSSIVKETSQKLNPIEKLGAVIIANLY